MWPVAFFVLVIAPYSVFGDLFIAGTESDVFDVTTIIDIGGLANSSSYQSYAVRRVHSRTNALGLPLFNGFEYIEKTQKPNITCDSTWKMCSWTLKDWALKSSTSIRHYSNLEEREYYNNMKSLGLVLKDKQENMVHFYLTSVESISTCEVYFEIKISQTDDIFQTMYRKCGCGVIGQYINYRYYYGGHSKRIFYCEVYKTFMQKGNALKFTLENGKLLMSDVLGGQIERIDSVGIEYLYIENGYSNIVKLLYESYLGEDYVSTTTGSEMVSPVITPQDRQLCLSIIFHVSSATKEPVLSVFSEDMSAERHMLYTIKQVKAGWNIENFNMNISGPLYPLKIVLQKTDDSEIKISRISSCSTDGQEVEIISPVKITIEDPSHDFKEVPFSATAYVKEPAEHIQKKDNASCLNGGVLTSAGCACLPGFNGFHCQSGCGRNRYGQDCGGLCSLRQKECQGLVLCTHPTGCHCAPGYHGGDCSQKCSAGWYGNDCVQKCGHCGDNAHCDIYTGECRSCEFGYISPYCKEESVYYPVGPQLSSSDYGTITVLFGDVLSYKGSGHPELYQVQYKDKEWKTYATKKFQHDLTAESSPVLETIDGLEDGISYQVRVLLMDESFNKYDGDLVGVSEIFTKCDVPDQYNYNLNYENDDTSLTFSWAYINTSLHWCPVKIYEVSWKEDWKWITEYTNENEFSITNLLPGSSIQFKVRAETSEGYSPYSEIVKAATRLTGFSSVRNLKSLSVESSSVDLSWEPPRGSEATKLRYTVSYKCVDRPACSPGCQTASEGHQSVVDTRTSLSLLLPFTKYKVTVTAENGQPASINVGTTDVVPTEVPTVSDLRPVRTNTSVTVFWEEVPVCSGFLLGYNYQLTKASESLIILDSGFTRWRSATFHNLTASTQYIVKVFILSTAGWNPGSFLAINVSTSATVPEAVRNLTVYKKGRGMVGLRWAEPRATYGKLKSFTVTYSLGQEVTSHTVEPSHCVVWPDLYCYTIEDLRSNRRYNISVSARNTEVAEDGEVVFISVVTKESPPSAPLNLTVTNSSSTSLELQWKYPDMANGIVRSFLISVEETEKYDQDSCCQIYPFVETAVKEESPSYNAEVSGLHPASTYFVSVSAKTVGLGPSQALVAYTRPPHMAFTDVPRVEVMQPALLTLQVVTWLEQEKLPEVNNSDVYSSLVKARILLAVLNDSQYDPEVSVSGITDIKLHSLLQQMIEKSFYFIAEYNQDDVIELSGTMNENDSPWGHPPAPLTSGLTYQLVAVQVLEYNGVYNVDLRYSEPVTFAY